MNAWSRNAWAVLFATASVLLAGEAVLSGTDDGADSRPVRGMRELRSPTVGVRGFIEQIVLPGPKLRVTAQHQSSPVIVRIVHVFPHGRAFRYDLEFYGLEPGEYDLSDFLEPAEGTKAVKLPPLPITIRSVLPAGQVEPNPLPDGRLPRLGGYRLWMTAAVAVWMGGFAAILLAGRRKPPVTAPAERPLSLADYLRPRLQQALEGRLSPEHHAELERMLFSWWRMRLGLMETDPAEAMRQMRADPQAGPLLNRMEQWMHHPDGRKTAELTELLKPYRDLPFDARESAGSPVPNRCDRE